MKDPSLHSPERRGPETGAPVAGTAGPSAPRGWRAVARPEGLSSAVRIVALGGGTGLPVVLDGLKQALFPAGSPWSEERDCDRITAVVTVADDGGSSGRLRREYHVLPPGDIRNCLLALAGGEPTVADLFTFRFNGRHELSNHSMGNLIITALSEIEHDFSKATERAGRMLAIRGKVRPSTCDLVTLEAELADGTKLKGESRISLTHKPIRRMRLQPEEAAALPEVVHAIEAADVVVIGPGSLYTSLIPVLLVRAIARAIEDSHAKVLLVVNLMTEPGETDDHTAIDFIHAIRRHAPRVPVHAALLNTAQPSPYLLQRYGAEGSKPVPMDPTSFREAGCRPVERDLLERGAVVRHDPRKLGQVILELAVEDEV